MVYVYVLLQGKIILSINHLSSCNSKKGNHYDDLNPFPSELARGSGDSEIGALGYDNDSSIFGPFVLLMPVFPLKCSLPLRRVSFDELASACASSLVSSCA